MNQEHEIVIYVDDDLGLFEIESVDRDTCPSVELPTTCIDGYDNSAEEAAMQLKAFFEWLGYRTVVKIKLKDSPLTEVR
jgi:hypothetical protein